jgi:hypothetical protein
VNVLLHPILPLGPFEKWGIDLMGSLLVIRKRHEFIVVIKKSLHKVCKSICLEILGETRSRTIFI